MVFGQRNVQNVRLNYMYCIVNARDLWVCNSNPAPVKYGTLLQKARHRCSIHASSCIDLA